MSFAKIIFLLGSIFVIQSSFSQIISAVVGVITAPPHRHKISPSQNVKFETWITVSNFSLQPV
ncbi:MAG: hypothetical protein JST48_00160 [Bacteroidetes bacterium]|nr:hypothetical protein [Bacteroidota bacterium]